MRLTTGKASRLVAVLAALIAVLGTEYFARRKERREIRALRASLASEIRMYVHSLINTRFILTLRKEAFQMGEEQLRDFRDLVVLRPPVVYPAVADRLGLLRRPRAAAVVDFYATIEQLYLAARTMSSEPTKKVLLSNYLVLVRVIEEGCRIGLRLLSAFPFDERDAEFRAEIAKWDAERPPEG